MKVGYCPSVILNPVFSISTFLLYTFIEKAQKEAEKEMQQKKKKTQQRGKPTSNDKQSKRNQTTPPTERPSKRVKLDSGKC